MKEGVDGEHPAADVCRVEQDCVRQRVCGDNQYTVHSNCRFGGFTTTFSDLYFVKTNFSNPMHLTLKHFILQQRVLALYRFAIRSTRCMYSFLMSHTQ